MKNGIKIFTAFLSLILLFGVLSVAVFAVTEETEPSMYGEYSFGGFDEYGDFDEEFSGGAYDDLTENETKVIFLLAISVLFFGVLFFPALILVIVFAVLNSKQKKKLHEYELRFRYFPQQNPVNFAEYNNVDNGQGGITQ